MTSVNPRLDPTLVKARMRFLNAVREHLDGKGYQEVQTPVLHPRLSGFEKGTGFSTFSSSLGERLWFRAAPELYLKRFMIDTAQSGVDRVFEMAICLRDEYDETAPRDSFDRPECMLLEVYEAAADPWSMEGLLRGAIEQGIGKLEAQGLLPSGGGAARLRKAWRRADFASLLRSMDPAFDLETLLHESSKPARGKGAALQASAIELRANDRALKDAAEGLAYKAGSLAGYLRVGPQGYWYDLIDHAFHTKVAPTLVEPTIVHRLPLESSPLAESGDGVHCDKWELYVNGVRVALAERELMDVDAQTVRFQHIDRLRRLGYELLPEPDEGYLNDLKRWPAGRPLIGMGVYMDRLAGALLGLLGDDGKGQERMVPNLFKLGSSKG